MPRLTVLRPRWQLLNDYAFAKRKSGECRIAREHALLSRGDLEKPRLRISNRARVIGVQLTKDRKDGHGDFNSRGKCPTFTELVVESPVADIVDQSKSFPTNFRIVHDQRFPLP